MAERQPRYDAVLIHALGNKVSGSIPDRLTQRSRLAVRAAIELSDTFVVSGSEFNGTRAMALNVKDELMKKYHVSEDHIIVATDRASTTSLELGFLREQAGEHPDWKKAANVSVEAHKPSMIALAVGRILPGWRFSRFVTAESVLENLPSQRNSERYRRYFEAIHQTKDEKNWRRYELLKFPLLIFPPTEWFLNKLATRWRPQVTKS